MPWLTAVNGGEEALVNLPGPGSRPGRPGQRRKGRLVQRGRPKAPEEAAPRKVQKNWPVGRAEGRGSPAGPEDKAPREGALGL